MKVLFTGASSFTGMWFACELARAGHEVVATFRQSREDYTEALRRERVGHALQACRCVFSCAFGDARFMELVAGEPWDLLCHHGADVTNYKSADFDVAAALAGNTRNLVGVVDALRRKPGTPPRVLLTGSVFESDEGAGSEGLPAFSPYGVSKSLTYQVFRYHVLRADLALGKFVIPNPFGPYEEARFTAYLLKNWLAGQTATVSTPAYVRDNIHVSLLAKAFVRFAQALPLRGLSRLGPSGYAESQGAFTLRVAAAMRERLGLPCDVTLAVQSAFAEPRVRINTDIPDVVDLGWNEGAAWDELTAFYRDRRVS